jgi:hypothetical protein
VFDQQSLRGTSFGAELSASIHKRNGTRSAATTLPSSAVAIRATRLFVLPLRDAVEEDERTALLEEIQSAE